MESKNTATETIEALEKANENIATLLTWGKLTDDERQRFTMASNANALASACMRDVGPHESVVIGF